MRSISRQISELGEPDCMYAKHHRPSMTLIHWSDLLTQVTVEHGAFPPALVPRMSTCRQNYNFEATFYYCDSNKKILRLLVSCCVLLLLA